VAKKKMFRVAAVLLILVLLTAACSSKGKTNTGAPKTGGIFRVQLKTFRWGGGGFDPSSTYSAYSWTIYSNMMIRSLLGYRHVAGDAGNQTIPDLATDNGTVSADGLTWTFHIKPGVKFSPPINRAVKASDIVYSFERIGKPSVAAGYSFYYLPTIVGMQDYYDKKATKISGITTQGDDTISFKLTKPTGDFNYRVSMPAAAPIPPEVGHCFENLGEYGRYVVSTGPYMFDGMAKMDPTSCATLKATVPSGFDPSPTGHLKLVRNPNYDPSTDTKESRENFIDGLTVEANSNVADIFDKILKNEVDGEIANETPNILQQATTTLKDQVHANEGDRTWYFSMNLTTPPFDDLHVRRAVNYILDKSALLKLAGGPISGTIAGHYFPPSILAGRLKDYDPFASTGSAGDLAKAKEEMKKSKYDKNGDGLCDAGNKACGPIYSPTEQAPPFSDYIPTVKNGFAKLGLKMNIVQVADSYTPANKTSNNIAFFMGGGWGKDYGDPFTFGFPLFYGPSILCDNNSNYSLVGETRAQAKACKNKYPASGSVLNVDKKVDDCAALAGDARLDCWANLDKYLTEEVAAWIPYRFATNVDTVAKTVTKYVFDQFSGYTAYAHVALDPSLQVSA
jgi:peptide/nickel transport system substrate-binding protein